MSNPTEVERRSFRIVLGDRGWLHYARFQDIPTANALDLKLMIDAYKAGVAENARLRAALQPFAKIAPMYDPPHAQPEDGAIYTWVTPELGEIELNVSHLREARDAVSSASREAEPVTGEFTAPKSTGRLIEDQ